MCDSLQVERVDVKRAILGEHCRRVSPRRVIPCSSCDVTQIARLFAVEYLQSVRHCQSRDCSPSVIRCRLIALMQSLRVLQAA